MRATLTSLLIRLLISTMPQFNTSLTASANNAEIANPIANSIDNSNAEHTTHYNDVDESWDRHIKYLNYVYRNVPENERSNPLSESWDESREYIPEEYQ